MLGALVGLGSTILPAADLIAWARDRTEIAREALRATRALLDDRVRNG